MAQQAPYGSWKSPITADLIVSASIGLGSPEPVGDELYWVELRPTEGGRMVIVRREADGTTKDVNPAPFNARTRVHEYGGGEHVVADDGTVYFSNFADQRIYRARRGEAPEALTQLGDMRYADAVIDEARGRLICVREDHTIAESEAVNTIVAVDLSSGDETVLTQGFDFYAYPRISADGSRLAWICWHHPNMPWDGADLCVAPVNDDGLLGNAATIAGGHEVSVFQPQWAEDGALYFVSDETGWWNLYRWRGSNLEALAPREAEFGQPLWQLGTTTYDFDGDDRIVCAYCERGSWKLATLNGATDDLQTFILPFTNIRDVRAKDGRAYCYANFADAPGAIISVDLETGAFEKIKSSAETQIDAGYVSLPETIEFPTGDGKTAFGFYYAPANKDYEAQAAGRGGEGADLQKRELPPLLVMSHGGPTAATFAAFSLRVQYWTSRGIGVLDVNYGGSTGYGRAYRERLNDRWGIVDVDDCVNGAKYLAERGSVDGERLAITGGSAGGYTTLCVLTFRDAFKAGASHYGVADLEALARDTHKFESRYLDGLIGPYPGDRDIYLERSPVYHVDLLNCPVIFFQGLEDQIVPPNQAEMMVEALRAKGVPVAYVAFEGEQHGFRQAANIKRSLEGELYFYARVFGFELAEPVEPVRIENL